MLAAGLASSTWQWGFSGWKQPAGQQGWLEELSPWELSALSKEEEQPKERKMKCIWKKEYLLMPMTGQSSLEHLGLAISVQ